MRNWTDTARTISLGALLLAGGCTTLPSSGPTAGQLLREGRENAASMGYEVVDITAQSMPSWGYPIPRSTLAMERLAGGGRVDVLGPGDVLDIQIFEVGTTLFGGAAAFSGGGGSSAEVSARQRPLSGVTVDREGRITLPYIGPLEVAGRTTTEVEKMIVRGLAGKSQAPQALVFVREAVASTVLVSGMVSSPGRQTLRLGGERLLDAIARAGGVRSPLVPSGTLVRFARGGQVIQTYLDAIVPGTVADVVLQPGDRIDLLDRARSVTVFGAARTVSQIAFQSDQLTLGEAIARAGGPTETLADARNVFVFRYVPAGTVDADGKAIPESTPERPIIYRLNMLQPSSYFLSQRFLMGDKDVIFVATARSAQTRKLVEIINLLVSPFLQASVQARAVGL